MFMKRGIVSIVVMTLFLFSCTNSQERNTADRRRAAEDRAISLIGKPAGWTISNISRTELYRGSPIVGIELMPVNSLVKARRSLCQSLVNGKIGNLKITPDGKYNCKFDDHLAGHFLLSNHSCLLEIGPVEQLALQPDDSSIDFGKSAITLKC
jgi:hypothetical protein